LVVPHGVGHDGNANRATNQFSLAYCFSVALGVDAAR
jgi:hypothetical protein